ncbi:hypothetical protein Javan173_0029 [Streptococcus phage Javan173]|nr:hypothetical protein Javan173_0029 [Streptococcus phage Javan173]
MYEVFSVHLMTGMVEVESGKYFLIPQDGFLMQSTGLFDKNGKEIFEGDAVTYNSSKSKYIVSFGQFICYFAAYNKCGENILRLAPGYGWYLKHFRDSFWNVSGEVMDEPAKIEVIGNIHEHPELMEDPSQEILQKKGEQQ